LADEQPRESQKESLLLHYNLRVWQSKVSVAALLMVSAAGCLAWDASGDEASTAENALTADDLGTFLDRMVPEQLSKRQIAGAEVVVVSEGKVLFGRGYGFADVANKIAMDSNASVVRPGSISKLFTAIAVMQLVEQRKLDLDRDVNSYLDFHVPTPTGGVPVTLRLLLTHRAGFENHLKNLFLPGTTPDPLAEWVRKSLPLRLFPNGDVPAYSNYGYALAGYVVERVSGERFDAYAASHILKPLGLTHSTFEQPLPAGLSARLSRGYGTSTQPPLPYFEVIAPAPAGGMSTTGADMEQFMLTLLDGTRLSAAGILRPETLQQMMTSPSRGDSVVDQPLLGFEEEYAAGNVLIGKHGLTSAFVTELALLPAQKFGIFVSYNSAAAFGQPTELVRAVVDRYFRQPQIHSDVMATRVADAAEAAGAYQSSQREDSSFFRLPALLRQLVVTASADGKIKVFGETFEETAPLHFEARHDMHVQFKRGKGGHEMSLRTSVVPLAMEWERVPGYLDARMVLPVVGTAVVIAGATLIFWPIAVLVRRRRGRPFGNTPPERRGYLWVRVVLAVDALTILGIVILASVATDDTQFNDKLDPWLIALYFCAWLGTFGAAYTIWVAFRFWRDRVAGLWGRIHHTLLACAAVVLAWFFVTWRIAGVTLNF
jgi:CubicO group peptidase (beta-lactamase class C family)